MLSGIRKRLAGRADLGGSPPPDSQSPYGQKEADFIYNLLFCDDPSLFRAAADQQADDPLHTVLQKDADAGAIRAIADDESLESRVRCLAFNWLRRNHQPVPKGKLLGTIVELGLPAGLDVIAAFVDGRVRYINQTGKLAVFEATPPQVAAEAANLLAVSKPIVGRIGPWDKPRRPRPPQGSLRMTFLVSDGLYFGEGPVSAMQNDPLAGPVYAQAGRLVQAITRAVV
ncbi:MAG TPA: hypothetical protein VHW09_17100 [Bryobacteraceae bacterium]|jgi:hypothetical protein|nr:hypothetical protein [Bryobacteraceae bacterium]